MSKSTILENFDKQFGDYSQDQSPALPPPEAKPLGELKPHEPGDARELLKHRFLCRGGGLLLVGPTGIGKSSFVMQCSILWALGQAAFGIRPSSRLRILVIQAENDEGDLAEMKCGVMAGLKLNNEDCEFASENILIATENARTSFEFANHVVKPLLAKHKPDLLIIDPALAYLGGDTNSQEDVGYLLRNQLNPLLSEFECACIVVHHTNKPPTGKEKSQWQAGDFAYLGSGSAEWSNWARAVLGIRSVGSHDVYELVAGKRGGRLGWKDAFDAKSYSRYIAHARDADVIFWREAEASEIPAGAQGGQSAESIVLSSIPQRGAVPKISLVGRAGVIGLGQNKVREILKDLVERKILFEHKKARSGNKPEIYLSRSAEAPDFGGSVSTVVTTGQI